MSLIVLMLASCTTEQPRPLGEPYSPEKSAVDGRDCYVSKQYLEDQSRALRWFEAKGIDFSDIDNCFEEERNSDIDFVIACYPLVKIKEAASCCTEVGATHVGWKTAEIGGSYRVPICR